MSETINPLYLHGPTGWGTGVPAVQTGNYNDWPQISMHLTVGDMERSGSTVSCTLSGGLNAQSDSVSPGGSTRFGYSVIVSAQLNSGSSVTLLSKPSDASYQSSWGSYTFSNKTVKCTTEDTKVTLHIYMASNCPCYSGEVAKEVYYEEFDAPPSTVTVTFNPNGGNWSGSTSNQTVTTTVGSSATISSNPTRTNYTFKEWNTKSGGSGTSYTGRTISNVTSDMTVYAQWTRITYTVTYKANGGQGSDYEDAVNSGASYSVKSASSCSISGKIYTLTYDAQGGSVNPEYKEVSCTFSKWNTSADGSGTSYSSGSTITISGNVTLYAIWSNPTMGSLPTPTYTDAEFTGWYTGTSASSSQVSSSTTMTGDTKIYAHYNYTIYYYFNTTSGTTAGDDDPSPGEDLGIYTYETKNYGVTYTIIKDKPTVPLKEFSYWSTTASGSGDSYDGGDSYTKNAPLYLYAQWDKGRYTVIFDANKGKFSDGSTQKKFTNVICGEQTVTSTYPPEDPTRKNHKFVGWLGNYMNITRDTTIKALWTYWPIWIRNKDREWEEFR